MDLVRNPLLALYFEWDAQRLFKYNGTEFVRFIDEPWTADRWYEIQVSAICFRKITVCLKAIISLHSPPMQNHYVGLSMLIKRSFLHLAPNLAIR